MKFLTVTKNLLKITLKVLSLEAINKNGLFFEIVPVERILSFSLHKI